MDNNTPLTDSSEYKFTEAEVPSSDGAAADTDKLYAASMLPEQEGWKMAMLNRLQNISWRRLIGPGVIGLAIMLVYWVFGFYSSKKTQISEQKKVMMQEDAAVGRYSAVSASPVLQQPVAAVALNAGINDERLTQLQTVVQQKLDTMTHQLANGQERLVSLNEAVSNTQQNITALNQRVEQLTVAIQELMLEIAKMKAAKAPKKKGEQLPVAYHIRAIIPGRVWLESADGKNVTLRVGDKLAGYGEVRLISPQQGMVIMSNGAIIQYGMNDF